MTVTEFNSQVGRLANQFGKGAYSDERIRLLWREVQDFDSSWFVRVVDRFIGECRQPPLLPEFREEISRERERGWTGEKQRNENEAKAFMRATFPPDDKRAIVQTIVKRITGGVSDLEWENFMKALDGAIYHSEMSSRGMRS